MTQTDSSRDPGSLPDAIEPDDGGLRPSVLAIPAGILLLVTAFIAADIYEDSHTGSPTGHLLVEAFSMALAVAGAALLWWKLFVVRRRARALRAHLTQARSALTQAQADAARFRQESEEAMRGLGAAIDRQFDRWELSSAEREVALLLLKGLPTKEIADVRDTSERTVRQQALAVYRKSGLAGRAELAAFFLEDLLLPVAARAQEGAPASAS